MTDLRDEDFVAHTGHGRSVLGDLLVTLASAAGFAPRIRHEVEETSTLVTLVAAGLGVAIVPAATSALDIAGIAYRALLPADLGIDLVSARAVDVSPVVDRALEVLRRVQGDAADGDG